MANRTPSPNDVHLLPWEVEGRDSNALKETASLFEAETSDDEEAPQDENESEVTDEVADAAEDELEEEDADADESEDDEADDEDEEQPDRPATLKVKVDGEEIEVTLDELARGYSRQSDYTRKTQQVAEQRKALEQEAAAVRTQRERYDKYLADLEQEFDVLKEPDWDALKKENPAQFAVQFAEYSRARQHRDAIRAEREKLYREAQEEQETHLRKHLAEEQGRLLQAVPEWKDEAKARDEIGKIATYAKTTYGFTQSDLDNVTDHRVMLILRKAMAFDEAKTKGREKVEEKAKGKPVLRAGARTPKPKGKVKAQRAAMEKLARSGRVRDAAAVIAGMLDD